jgi:hypothetical protein
MLATSSLGTERGILRKGVKRVLSRNLANGKTGVMKVRNLFLISLQELDPSARI